MSDSLTCPKCGSAMRTYERNEVVVDQCTGCGGLFLDRGELERLVAAENLWHQQSAPVAPPAAPAAPAPPAPPVAVQDHRQGYGEGHRQQEYRQEYRQEDYRPDHRQQGYRPKKKKSFLSELFDD